MDGLVDLEGTEKDQYTEKSHICCLTPQIMLQNKTCIKKFIALKLCVQLKSNWNSIAEEKTKTP